MEQWEIDLRRKVKREQNVFKFIVFPVIGILFIWVIIIAIQFFIKK